MQKVLHGTKYIKPAPAPALKIKQLTYEINTWKRLLDFMTDEIIHQKYKLSEILNNNFTPVLLNEVENYLSRFIKEDELNGMLRYDVAEIDYLLEKNIMEVGKITPDIEKRLTILRNDISIAETEFRKLKVEFNNFILAIFFK